MTVRAKWSRFVWLVIWSAVSASPATNACRADDQADKLVGTFLDEFVEITPGKGEFPDRFQMGSETAISERPVHEVKMTQPFAIAKYEVPQNLYQAVMGNNPSHWKGPRNSAEMMTWTDAKTFCTKVTELARQQKRIQENEEIRLPTEIEWEYCCRAGTTTAYSFGDAAQKSGEVGLKAGILDEYGWHTGNAAGNDPAVGVLKPNPWKLFDMHGYLWEYTADSWTADYQLASGDDSGKRPESPKMIVLRSGS